MSSPLDRRRHAIRDDLADVRLKDRVVRPAYAEPRRMVVAAPFARCHPVPGGEAVDTEFLCGEPVDVFAAGDDRKADADGWSWVQSAVDGYVGYVRAEALAEPGPAPTHLVAVPSGILYPVPSIKRGVAGWLPLGGAVRVAETVEDGEAFARIGGGGGAFMLMKHLRPAGEPAADFVAIAELFVGTPYVWGGKTWSGIDCSGLVQLALQAAGLSAPRDSDMQAAELGEPLGEGETPARGDLVFWKGHVGIMVDAERLLHANGHHMMTAVEPLAEAVGRLASMGLPVTTWRRPAAAVARKPLPEGGLTA